MLPAELSTLARVNFKYRVAASIAAWAGIWDVEMRLKKQRHAQSREDVLECNRLASEEFQKFIRAIESYPERFAKEPGITFRRHLSSLFSTSRKDNHADTRRSD